MMFENNSGNYNNDNKISVNTTIFTSYGHDSLLVLGCWNDKVSIRIANSVGLDANGRTQYMRDTALVTSLSIENTSLLTALIEDKIFPAIKEEKEASITIKIAENSGNEKLFTVYTKDGEVKVIIRQPGAENAYTHTFPSKTYFDDLELNPNAPEKKAPATFMAIYDRLKAFVLAGGLVSHGIKHSDAIRQRLANNYNNRNYNQNNANQAPSYSAPTTTFNGDAAEFLPFN